MTEYHARLGLIRPLTGKAVRKSADWVPYLRERNALVVIVLETSLIALSKPQLWDTRRRKLTADVLYLI